MKRIFTLCLLSIISFTSCTEDADDNPITDVKPIFNFTHNWDGNTVSSSDFNNTQYTNQNGEILTIERLRYLISDVTFTRADGVEITIGGHNLIDLTTDSNLQYNPDVDIPRDEYTNVSFTFGFDNEDNAENYVDLNSASFNVPALLGGGYHYMQFDGKFINNSNVEQGFNYHAIRAVDNTNPQDLMFEDTFFDVDLGPVTVTNNTTIEIKMNIAEWFKNPISWDLNQYNQMLMPNSTAQIMMYDNGQNVFSLGEITP